jgi:anti-sigma factor RsiW
MMDDMHVLDLLPAYALGSLDEDEARLVQEHLPGCLVCRRELDAFQRIADGLSLVAPDVPPPDALRHRLTERIQRLKPEPRQRSTGWRLPQRLVPAGLVAGLVLIVLLGISNLVLWQRLQSMEMVRGPLGMRAIALQNTTAASAASGFVVISADGADGVLVVDELPQLDENHEYQAWLVRDGVDTNAGVFSVDESGYRGMRLNAPESLLLYSNVYVTVEPTGGSGAPTGTQVLNGSLFNR